MRVLLTSGYSHPSHFRKLELLADAPDVELLNLQIYKERPEGRYPSANGQRTYMLRHLPTFWPQRDFDPHRAIHIPPRLRLREFKPDIIHSEHEQESLGAAQLALARTLRTPHTPLLLYSWQNLIRPRSLPVRLICAYTLRAAQHFMCASQEAIDVLRQQGYQGGASIIPIVGLDTRFFYPKPVDALRRRLGLEGVVVGYLGRLVKEKGLDTLLQAVAAARETQPNLRLLLVGSGPEQAALQALADRLGIADITVFQAAVNHDQVVDYMNAMDIFVLPSRTTPNWKEQLGRVLYEAMGCNVAVIGSDSGAIPEVIGDGGIVFREGDITALADTIRLLAGQDRLCIEVAQRGYARAISHYSIEHIAQDTLVLWRDLQNPGLNNRNSL